MRAALHGGDGRSGAVEFVYGGVEGCVGFDEGGRHGVGVVEVGKGAFGKEGAGIQHGLSFLYYVLFLAFGSGRPRKIIVDNLCRIAVVAFKSAADGAGPCHVHL